MTATRAFSPEPVLAAPIDDAPIGGARVGAEVPDHHENAEAPPSTTTIAHRAGRMTVFVKSGGSYGAGVLMDGAGHILTCNHVAGDVEHVEVSFENDAQPRTARLVGRDAQMDLALLRLDQPPPAEALAAMTHPLGRPGDLERGELLYAMGSPRKMTFSFHRGMVSYLGRSFDDVRFIQTDLPMNPGSSGGPVFDHRGRLVGIASFIIRDGQGLSFALPIDYALRRFTELAGSDDHVQRLAAFDRWLRSPGTSAGDEARIAPTSSPR